jgi:hypothetical protein
MGIGQMLRHVLPDQRLHSRLGHPRPAQHRARLPRQRSGSSTRFDVQNAGQNSGSNQVPTKSLQNPQKES